MNRRQTIYLTTSAMLGAAIACAPLWRASAQGAHAGPAHLAAASAPVGYVNGLCFGARPTIVVTSPTGLHSGNLVRGGNGDNVIVTSNGSYTIDGGNGNNKICALGGNNTIDGGNGDNLIAVYGAGHNTIDGGNGTSRCYVGAGHNVVHCSYVGRLTGAVPTTAGAATAPARGSTASVPVGYVNGLCFGARPTITVSNPSLTANTVVGTDGADVIVTRNGSYTVNSGDGNDKVCALGGNNTIHAGAGNVEIWTGAGNNAIRTGDGRNWIIAGPGNNVVYGDSHSHCDIGGGNSIVHCAYVGPIRAAPLNP